MEIWAKVVDKGMSDTIDNGDLVYAKARRGDAVVWAKPSGRRSHLIKTVELVKVEDLSEEEKSAILMVHPEIGKYLNE